MKKNMGNLDRILRILVAVLFVVLYFTEVITGIWGIVILVLAAMFFITSLISFCPLYLPFGIRTSRRPRG
ncbi:MAG TPA: DUF2892 domain-containing protein [Bacteroidales bacterium]|nr:DUF2892 domain-containing protein [Bacteroidales bacterium]